MLYSQILDYTHTLFGSVGDRIAVKTEEIITHYHLVHVPIDIVVSKGPQICLDHSTYLSSHRLQDTEVSMHNYLHITHAHCNPDSIFYQVMGPTPL